MATTIKFKSIWYSFFQAQNSMLIQKSIKHVDKFDDSRTTKKSSATTNEPIEFDSASHAGSETSSSMNDDYRLKREKNNESVRKSRAKSRVKLQECASRVQEFRSENDVLNNKLSNLQAELFTLRGLFKHCFTLNNNNMPVKPSEIPTSTLYKMIMQNQAKLGIGAPAAAQPALQTSTLLPITDSLTSSSFFQQPQQQSAEPTTNLSSSSSALLQLQDIQESIPSPAISDEFYINELKNVLMNSVSSPELPVSPQSIEEQQAPLLTNEMVTLLDADDMIVSNEQLTFLNDFDASSSSSSSSVSTQYQQQMTNNDDPLLSSPLLTTSESSTDMMMMMTENLVMLDHDYTLRRASAAN